MFFIWKSNRKVVFFMKKILSMVCAAALAVSAFGMAVCAAPSPTQEVPEVSSGTSNGAAVELVAESAEAYMESWVADEDIADPVVSLLEQMVENTISMTAALEQMFDEPGAVVTTSGETVDMSGFAMLIAPFDLHLTNGESATNVTATFVSRAVIGLSDANQVTVLHYNTVSKAWEAISPDHVDYSTGAITATFANLSPVAVVYQPTAQGGSGAAGTAEGSATAPKTSDSSLLGVYAAAAVLAAGAIILINRKRRQA